jgi:type II secretory pathway pseudopilin PulG
MRKQKRQKGFVLILVLAMLAIAALISAGMARRSLDQSVAVAKKQAEMQRRWGEISCRQAVLNRAEILLRTAELREGILTPTIQTTLKLGDQTFLLILSDEQAKLNLNTVFRNGDMPAVRQAVFTDAAAWQLRLRPDSRATKTNIYPPAFASWGQVYDFSVFANNPDKNYLQLTQLGERTTCWGNGLLNINRADSETLRTVCELVAPPQSVSRFIEFRHENPTRTLEQLLKDADISDKDRRAFRKMLTDRSRCHSLWTVTSNEKRSWVRFDIRTTEMATGNDIETFYW